MILKPVPLLLFLFLNAGFLLSAADGDMTPKPQSSEPESSAAADRENQSRYFRDSGNQMDSLVDRIRFKISYSMEKAKEYFNLACSSVTDTLPAKGRDLKAHANMEYEDLLEKGRKVVSETTEQAMQDFSRRGREIGQDFSSKGREIGQDISSKGRKIGQDISRKGREIGQDAQKLGTELKNDVSNGFRGQTDRKDR